MGGRGRDPGSMSLRDDELEERQFYCPRHYCADCAPANRYAAAVVRCSLCPQSLCAHHQNARAQAMAGHSEEVIGGVAATLCPECSHALHTDRGQSKGPKREKPEHAK